MDALLLPRRLVLQRRQDLHAYRPLRRVVPAQAKVSATTPASSGELRAGALCWVTLGGVVALLSGGNIVVHCGNDYGGCGEM